MPYKDLSLVRGEAKGNWQIQREREREGGCARAKEENREVEFHVKRTGEQNTAKRER